MKPTREDRESIVQTWIDSGAGPVTIRVLSDILGSLARHNLPSDVSPAAVARILADEGAELRHPDVIEFDAQWRESRFKKSKLALSRKNADRPLTLKSAEALLKRFEGLRQKLPAGAKSDESRELREAALNEKAKAQLLAHDDALDHSVRNVQEEIAEWFRVWLQTPEIFADWLELRRRSREFNETFKAQKSSNTV